MNYERSPGERQGSKRIKNQFFRYVSRAWLKH